ncbi:MAG: TfoX/Sxy family protein [Actinobacteria bacterium]|jgi:TfoX/Sxy family transcriptional regulator of competence genes|nr:TfoX/Sxy family protein [Actinomycetota bacterium]
MAYDEGLAERIRELVAGERGISEKRMFGGLAFLLDGHMAIAASGQGGALVRVDPADTGTLLAKGPAEPMVMRGREMDGWVRVPSEALRTRAQLSRWTERALAFVRTLPPKA